MASAFATPSHRLATAAAAGVVVLSIAGSAQVAPRTSAAQVALYSAADRQQKLVEGARKEGTLTVYTSAQVVDFDSLAKAFEKKYGVKIVVWRAGSENVAQRALQEDRAKRFTVDVLETNGPELEALHRERILQQVRSPYHADLIAQAVPPHGEWAGVRMNVFVQAYNTRLVKKQDLPKTWEDLTNPRWKGKLGIEQEDTDWLAGLFSDIGEAKGRAIFQSIAASNGISVRKGHTLLTQLVISGEVPLALTVYNYKAEQLKNQGAPIDWFSIGKAIARPNGIAVARNASHPHAAVLFYDFTLSPEGQQIIASREFVPTSKKIDTKLNQLPMTFVDVKVAIDEKAKWTALYRQLFGGHGA